MLAAAGTAPCAETPEDILAAARNINLDGNPYHQALVLKHITQIHQLRAQDQISDLQYQNVMVWHQCMNFLLAKKAGDAVKLNVALQAMDPSKSLYRPGSDSDYLVSRPGARSVTLEDIQALEQAYRIEVNAAVARLSKQAGRPVAPPGKVFHTSTDFMANVDNLSEAEFTRIAAYLRSKGSDTYDRLAAARVEAQLRTPGARFDVAEIGGYVEEMIEQANRKGAKIARLNEQLATASAAERAELVGQIKILTEERTKYVERITAANRQLAGQVRLATPLPEVPCEGDYTTAGRAQYTQILRGITATSGQGTDTRRQARFLLGLQLYQLPDAQRTAYLESLSPTIRREVEAQVKQFREQEQTRVSEADVGRLRSFLNGTEAGRKLLGSCEGTLEALMRERGRVTPAMQGLGDVVGGIDATTQHVGNRAMQLSLLLDLLKQARESSDADLAIAVGRTLAANTHYGMVAGYAYTALVERDPEALAKSLTVLYCPQAALPQVVQAIGNSAIDLTTSVLFDHQFTVLYVSSKFDAKTGALTGIEGYDGASSVSQFVEAALSGDTSSIEGVFARARALAKEQNLGTEALAGLDAALGRPAMVKALCSTIYGGAPQVMKDDPGLLAACGEVNACTKAIDDFVTAFGRPGTVPLDADPGFTVAGLGEDQQRALKKLLVLRAAAWDRAKSALCAGIKAGLEARHRAQAQLGQGKGDEELLNLRATVEEIFRELDMYDLGMAWMNSEAQYNFILRTLVISTPEQRIKAMETLQRYHAAYSAVLQMRSTLEATYVAAGGQRLTPRPLTGTPPMTADPAFDRAAAATLATAVLQQLADTEVRLLRIKREALNDGAAELEEGFDRRTYGGLCGAIMSLHNCTATAAGATHARSRLHKVQVLAVNDLFAAGSAASAEARTWGARIEKLEADFEAYYRMRVPGLTLLPPPAVVEGRAAAETQYAFRVAASNVPAEAVYTWYADSVEVGRGPVLCHAFPAKGTHAMRVVASWDRSARVLRAGRVEATLTSTIGPAGSDEEKRPALMLDLPAALAGGEGRVGENYAISVRSRNVPDAAIFTWYDGVTPIGSGRTLRQAFPTPGMVRLAVCAAWDVPNSAGGEEVWETAAFRIVEESPPPTLGIVPPPEVSAGQARPKLNYTFVALPGNLPPSATYRWLLDGRSIPGSETAILAFLAEGPHTLVLEARWPGADAASTGGIARATLAVPVGKPEEVPPEPPRFTLKIAGPAGAAVGDGVLLTAAVGAENETARAAQKTIALDWTVAGKPAGRGTTCAFDPPAPGKYEVYLRLSAGGKPLCGARHTVTVRKPDVKKPKKTGGSGGGGGTSGTATGTWVLVRTSDDGPSAGSPTFARRATVQGRTLRIQDVHDPVITMFEPPASVPVGTRLPVAFSLKRASYTGTSDDTLVQMEPRNMPDSIGVGMHWSSDGFGVNCRTHWRAAATQGVLTVEYGYGYVPANQWNPDTAMASEFARSYVYALQGGAGFAVTLAAQPAQPQPGQTVSVQSAVTGGLPPLTYRWSGAQGEGATATLVLGPTGSNVVTVTVTDQAGAMATTNLAIVAAPFQVRIARAAPGAPLQVGSTEDFTAEVTAGGQPAPPSAYTLLWQPHPEVEFTPFEDAARTTVRFGRPGRVTVWAEVLPRSAGTAAIASAPLDVQIGLPALSLRCTPETAQVGTEVRARLDAVPDPADQMDVRWELPANARLLRESPDTREIVFLMTDLTPATIKARGRSKFHGDDLGEATATVQAGAFAVTARVLGRLGPQPMMWDPARGGLVPAPEDAYVVDEAVRVQATLSGEPRPDPVRWEWTVNDGTTLRGSGIGDTISVTRSTPGAAVARVTARDAEGRDLGSATVTCTFMPNEAPPPLAVTVSAASVAVKSGDRLPVQAAVKGGVPPYTITWAGAQGPAETAVCTGGRAGKQKVTATVKDRAGTTAADTLELTVEAVELGVDLRAAKRELTQGESATLQAAVRGGTPPYTYAWSGAAGAGATATFTALAPGATNVGVKVADTWGNTGQAAMTLTVGSLTVQAVLVGVTGEPALCWDDVGHTLKPAAGQYAAGQRARVRASVVGAALPAGSVFAWTVGAGGRLAGAANGAETEVALEDKGTVEAGVVLSSGTAAELGRATVRIPVAFSRADLEAEKRKAADWALEQERERRAQALIDEAYALEQKGALPAAVAKYKESLTFKDDPRVREHIAALEKKIADRKRAQELIAQGGEFEAAGKLEAALTAFQEALNLAPDEGLLQRVAQLKIRIANEKRAQDLVQQGYAREQVPDLRGAVQLYREANDLCPDAGLARHIAELERKLAAEARAQALVQRGYAREQVPDLPGAIDLYMQANNLCPDAGLARHIAELRARLAAAAAVPPPPPAPTPAISKPAPPKKSPTVVPAPRTVPTVPPAPPPVVRTPAPAPAPKPEPVRRLDISGTYRGRAAVAEINDRKVYADIVLTIVQDGDQVSLRIRMTTPDGMDESDTVNGRIIGDRIEAGDQTLRIEDGGRTIVDQAGARFSK